jgi:hypothetical protein
MSDDSARPAHEAAPASHDLESRARMKQWLDTWARVGPILEAERRERLAAMTDEEAQAASQRVLELWQPEWHGDNGEGLLLLQRVIARAPR